MAGEGKSGITSSITSNTTVSIAFVVVLVGGSFTLGQQITSVRGDLEIINASIAVIQTDVAELNSKVMDKSCLGLHRAQLAEWARTMQRKNPSVKVPNPFNPRHLAFPLQRDCVGYYDRAENP